MTKKSAFGFTLIELLVVIAIISILASFAFVSYMTSLKHARDSQRRSDIKQYQTLLEQYANNHGFTYYNPTTIPGPATDSYSSTPTTLCTGLGMTPCLDDPTGPGDYHYAVPADGTTYKIAASLEVPSTDILGNTLPWWETCSNGKTGFAQTFATTTTSCDLP